MLFPKVRFLFFYYLPDLIVLFSTMAILGSLFAAKSALIHRQEVNALRHQLPVNVPAEAPPLGQESIDRALEMFHIQVPSNTNSPRWDPDLQDRGLTTLRAAGSRLEVTIGPMAFESWALLGSTLAHELEVHCQQNFTLIRLMDMTGLEGTYRAERIAYLHEISNAKRFGMKRETASSIEETMEFYYPESGARESFPAALATSLGDWLAAPQNLL